jgi:hypothetical protein
VCLLYLKYLLYSAVVVFTCDGKAVAVASPKIQISCL